MKLKCNSNLITSIWYLLSFCVLSMETCTQYTFPCFFLIQFLNCSLHKASTLSVTAERCFLLSFWMICLWVFFSFLSWVCLSVSIYLHLISCHTPSIYICPQCCLFYIEHIRFILLIKEHLAPYQPLEAISLFMTFDLFMM